jgi:uncharacterized protein (DUF433 family)
MNAQIVDNRISGTRITVWDVVHYLEAGWSQDEIRDVLGLTSEQLQDAVKYIDEHRDEVMKVHQQIEARNARGNSPEIDAKLAASRAKLQRWKQERRHVET